MLQFDEKELESALKIGVFRYKGKKKFNYILLKGGIIILDFIEESRLPKNCCPEETEDLEKIKKSIERDFGFQKLAPITLL